MKYVHFAYQSGFSWGGGEGGKEKSSGTLKLVNLSCGEKTKKKLLLDA